jgi:hypothetical protein
LEARAVGGAPPSVEAIVRGADERRLSQPQVIGAIRFVNVCTSA